MANPFEALGSRIQQAINQSPIVQAFKPGTPTMPGVGQRTQPPLTGPASELDNYAERIGHFESGGRYGALGPQLRNGDRAYGKYQVLGSNVGPWTERYYGKRLSPQEFLADKSAQDAVFRGQFGSYLQRFGNPQDAASMWFSGRPYARGKDLKDQVTKISGRSYIAGTVGPAEGSQRLPTPPGDNGPPAQASGRPAPDSRFDYTGTGRENPYSADSQKRHSTGAEAKAPDMTPEGLPQDTDPYQGPDPQLLAQLDKGDTAGLKRLPPELTVDAIRAYGASKRITVPGVAGAGPYGVAMTGGIRG